MSRFSSLRRRRAAFTLLELLVVILIIGILVSLLASGVMKAMGKIPQVQTSTEIAQMSLGLGHFTSDFELNAPPPSTLYLCEDRNAWFNVYGVPSSGTNPLYLASLTMLQKMFGRNFPGTANPRTTALKPPLGWDDWNGDGNVQPPMLLQGQHCLVFWLGGVPTYSGSGTIDVSGFSTSNLDPAAPGALAPKRRGPYYNFAQSRLTIDPRCPGYPVYQDPYQSKTAKQLFGVPQVYGFFSTAGLNNTYSVLDCSLIGASVYYTGLDAVTKKPNYLSSNGFQIISAGVDGQFGYDPLTPGIALWLPNVGFTNTSGAEAGTSLAAGNQIPAGNDDQANFATGLLGTGQQ